jgi:T-complex protein 1 subunit theta
MRRGIPNLFKEGTKHRTGLQEAVLRNLEACKQLADIVRSSMGPNGMNKMVINHLDKIFVTSDTATLMQEMEIQHPAAKMIIMASQMQESEIGANNFPIKSRYRGAIAVKLTDFCALL